MTDTRRLTIDIDVQSGELTRVNNQLLETEKRGNNATKSMTALGVGYLAVSHGIRDVMSVARPMLDFLKEAARLSSDLTEAQNLATVSFGKDAEAMKQWARTSTTAMTETGVAVQSMAARYFVLFKNQGIAREEALKMSKAMTDLTGDIGSFMNLPVDEAFAKLRSGLAGESEPLKQLNVFIQEADVKTRAYTDGLAKQGEELTRSQKLLSRYNLIMDQTTEAQGDLERTSDSYANVLRNLSKRWEEYQAEIGKFITNNPFLLDALKGISSALDGQTNAMAAAERQGAPYIEMMRSVGLAAIDAAGMVGRFSFAMQAAAAYADRAEGWLNSWAATEESGRISGRQQQDNANQRLNQLAQDWAAFDSDMRATRMGIQYGTTGPNLPSAPGGSGVSTGGYGGGSTGGAGRAKAARPVMSPLEIMQRFGDVGAELRSMTAGVTGMPGGLGDWFNYGGTTAMQRGAGIMRTMGAFRRQQAAAMAPWGGAFDTGSGMELDDSWTFRPGRLLVGMMNQQRNRMQGAGAGIAGGIAGVAQDQIGSVPWYMTAGAQRWGGVAGGLMSGGLSGGLSAAGGIFGSMLGPLGGLAGSWLGNKLGGLFGGGKKRPDAGMTPAQPIYTSDVNLTNLIAEFLNVTRVGMLRGAGGGIDAGTAGLQAAAGFKSTMPAMR